MLNRKDISNNLREAAVTVHEPGKGYEARSTMRKITHKWQTSETAASLPRSGCLNKLIARSDLAMFREIAE